MPVKNLFITVGIYTFALVSLERIKKFRSFQ